jgi:hypothetical protein
MKRSLVFAVPFVLAVPVVIGIVIAAAGYPIEVWPLVAGAIGWVVALAVRAPVALIGMRVLGDMERLRRFIPWVSGPAEEGVRVVVVLLVGRELGTALWIGFGWAAIEVVYAVINGFALAQLENRTDEEAMQAKAILPPAMLDASAPWWGVLERVFASAIHIGFTLIVAFAPIAFLLTMVVHSLFNVAIVSLVRTRPMWVPMLLGTVVGFAVLLIGLALFGVFA